MKNQKLGFRVSKLRTLGLDTEGMCVERRNTEANENEVMLAGNETGTVI